MWKKIVFGIVIAALVGAGIYWFTYTKELRTPISEAINAIPGDAAFIFESKQSKSSWKKLSQTSVLWRELLGVKTFGKIDVQANYIDSLLNTDPAISKLLENHSLFISAHVSGASTFDFLYVYSLPNLTYKSSLNEFLKKTSTAGKPSIKEYSGTDIVTVYSGKTNKDSMSYSFLNGILMMSSKSTLVEDAVRQLKSGISLAMDKNFSKIITTAGKNVDANLYINYKNFPDIISHFIAPSVSREVNSLPDFADCSGWDIAIKPNALSLSGFTQANDSAARFLNLFRKQEPCEMEVVKIIPSKTALLLSLSISNIRTFHHDYKNYLSATQQLKLQSYEQYVESVNRKYDISIERSVLDWIDNEIALVVTEPGSLEYSSNCYAVIRAGNIDEAINSLNELANASEVDKEKTESETDAESTAPEVDRDKKKVSSESHLPKEKYRNHEIGFINIPQLLPQLLGWQFKKISSTYFTSIEDYVVFANSIEALQSFIDAFENNKVLAKDKNYKLFSENISAEANVYLYSSIARSANLYTSVINDELGKELENQLETLYKFEAVGLQFTINPTNKLFYSNAYLKYNPDYKQQSGTLWETKLDTSLTNMPYLVVNHNTQTKEIVIQDDADKLYLVSNTGKVLWNKQLEDPILSDIKQVDALKNNKLQLLFNTKKAIHLCDRNGKEMRGFPLQLPSPATSPVSVFDYENNRDYRIFVACEDKKIRCYKLSGDEVTGFKFNKTEAEIHLPLQYHKFDGKDHLVAVDEKGRIYIVNRQGETIVKLKEPLPAGCRNFYVEPGKDYSKSFVVAADTIGNVVKISLSGEKLKIRLKKFSETTSFEFRDINNDKAGEYIFISGNELSVFSQNESLLFNYEFKETITKGPLVVTLPDGSVKIGAVSGQTNELYLLNANGSMYQGFPVAGKTAFVLGDINNDGTIMLVTGSSDNSIYVYQLRLPPL
ncbi:MAG: DUF3352 domain-containing protein [Bacteroidia bacterium]